MKPTRQTVGEFQGEYRFLSNFWPASVKLDDEVYPTVEHAYQAAKFEERWRPIIQKARTPGIAKRAAHVNRGLVRRDWKEVKLEVMRRLLVQKFSNPGLRSRLCATGNAVLVEGNVWGDMYWGVSLKSGIGQNMLGQLLMEIRAEVC